MTLDVSPAPSGTRELLQSIVEVAMAIFGAAASSVFLLDEPEGELVFEAVAGAGQDFLIGTRIPAGRGIAGWVVSSGQAVIADDLTGNRTFARDLAESTGYVPQALMAAPLLSAGEVLGVLEVIDPAVQSRSSLGDLDLLSLFANQAATALRVARGCSHCRDDSEPLVRLAADESELGAQLVGVFKDFLRHRNG
ncbi:GAF domain-containing protein [Kibdelosporangium persicum]|uniref:Metal dependent phosphohydrolase n=1 Tax=Kibdelosporangium persicum TaxID=2698649 RepID=A0ABX2FAF4_9PSEU|nr:GAF domain-containing protein [Kibdelosporangium persicum]NRN67910.1 Metal dependent phosphohydrolase [Kibdelosporangium persicum]